MKRILNTILAVGMVVALLTSFVLPIFADDNKGLRKGDKVVIDNGVVTEYLGENPDGTRNWEATIGSPQYLDDLVTPIDCSWTWDSGEKEWIAGANLYRATVKGSKVTLEYEDKRFSWQPDVYIGGKKQGITSSAGELLIIDPINENYFGNTLQWTYGNITRNLRIIEGMLLEYYTIGSMPSGDVTIKVNANKDVGFVWSRPSEAWDAGYNPLTLRQEKDKEIVLTIEAMQGAIFPITIDPETTFYTSSSDGHLDREDAVWATTRESAVAEGKNSSLIYLFVIASEVDGVYEVLRSYVYFDTSALPDGCTITDTELDMYLQSMADADNAKVYIVEGMDTYPRDPLIVQDYNYNYYTFGSTYGNADAGTDLTISQYNKVNTNDSAELKGIVNKTGTTKLCLVERHDLADETPDARSRFWFYSYEKGAGYRPRLVVTYSATAAPTITTDAASAIAEHTARLNSTLTDDGGGNVRSRFGYGTVSKGAIADYDVQADWTGYIYNTGEHPFEDIDSLNTDDEYFFRVEMQNDQGTTLGGELSFTTEADVGTPTNFRGIPQSTSTSLSWTKGAGSTESIIRYASDDYPDATNDGLSVYQGTSASYTHEELTMGTTYYYSVWGWSDPDESASYDTVMVTTSAADDDAEDLETPTTPIRWLAAPDYTNLSNLLVLYDAVNNTADSLELPRETLWMVLAILGAVALGILIYIVSGYKMLLGMIAAIIALVFGWAIKIVPFWIPLMAMLLLVTLKISHREVEH